MDFKANRRNRENPIKKQKLQKMQKNPKVCKAFIQKKHTSIGQLAKFD
jgi:hypothetical protein